MKHIAKRISAVFMALLLTLTMVPAAAEAAVSVPKSVTVYQNSSTGTSYVNFSISGLTSKQSIAKASIKSSNTKVAAPNSISHNSSNYKTEYFVEGQKPYEHSNKSVSMSFVSQKTGKSTISYKINGKQYKTNVTVNKYVNPIKSLIITGVGSSNLAGKFKNGNFAEARVAGSKSINQVKITAASGWKIKYANLYDTKTSIDYSVGAYSKPVSSATLYTCALKKGQNYSVYISLTNTKTGGELFINMNLN